MRRATEMPNPANTIPTNMMASLFSGMYMKEKIVGSIT
jgi:hypothetical protein